MDMTRPSTALRETTQRQQREWLGTLACTAAVLLGGAHLVVNTRDFFSGGPLSGADYALYFGYVIGVSALCVIFGLAALALYQPWGQRFSRRMLQVTVWIGTVLITALAILTIIQTITTRDLSRLTFAGPGPWASACGPLLGLAAWLFPVHKERGTAIVYSAILG